jgi:hypothetical protein
MAFKEQDMRENAKACFKEALAIDVRCYEVISIYTGLGCNDFNPNADSKRRRSLDRFTQFNGLSNL